MGTLDAGSTGLLNQAASVLNITDPTTLVAVGLASHVSLVTVEISFYLGWDSSIGPVDPVGETLSVEFGERGYQMFDLDTPIELTAGSTLIVLVDYEDGVNTIPYVLGGNGVDPVAEGLSYYWDATTGMWVDFGQMPDAGVFFLKGIVAVPEPGAGTYVLVFAVFSLGWIIHRRKKTASTNT